VVSHRNVACGGGWTWLSCGLKFGSYRRVRESGRHGPLRLAAATQELCGKCIRIRTQNSRQFYERSERIARL